MALNFSHYWLSTREWWRSLYLLCCFIFSIVVFTSRDIYFEFFMFTIRSSTYSFSRRSRSSILIIKCYSCYYTNVVLSLSERHQALATRNSNYISPTYLALPFSPNRVHVYRGTFIDFIFIIPVYLGSLAVVWSVLDWAQLPNTRPSLWFKCPRDWDKLGIAANYNWHLSLAKSKSQEIPAFVFLTKIAPHREIGSMTE